MQRVTSWRPLASPPRCRYTAVVQASTIAANASRRHPHNVAIKRKDTLHFAYGRDSEGISKARSLLREILRECTYLPDPNARRYMSNSVLSRFRTYTYKVWQHREDPGFAQRVSDQLKRARKLRNDLKRANEGNHDALLRCLSLTYGRIGKRRYALLEPLMPSKGRQDILALATPRHTLREDTTGAVQGSEGADMDLGEETLSDTDLDTDSDIAVDGLETSNSSHVDKALPDLTPELYTLAASQKKLNIPNSKKAPKQLQPEVPQLNARLLPMPKKRVQNMTHQWYAKVLGKILAPLPTNEWEQLRLWGQGIDLPNISIPRRRSCADSDYSSFSKRSVLETIVVQGRVNADHAFPGRDVHQITPRFMQRLWAQVFSQCPVMDWDDVQKKWSVRWGAQELASIAKKQNSRQQACPPISTSENAHPVDVTESR